MDDAKVKAELEACEREMALLWAESAADAAGIIDPTPCSDLVGAGFALRRGDFVGASLNLVSVLPWLGDAVGKSAKAARLMTRFRALRERIATLRGQMTRGRPAQRLDEPLPPTAKSSPTARVGLHEVPLDQIPPPRSGTVRVYRGTRHPQATQVSSRQRELAQGNPQHTPPRGDREYMMLGDAKHHAGSVGHPDAVSVTTDLTTAAAPGAGYGTHVIAYDVPKSVFDRLPTGDPVLGEKVFMHSIPSEFGRVVARKQ